MQIQLNWSDFKTTISDRKIGIQYFTKGDNYHLIAFDSHLIFSCKIDKQGTDGTDFENNYKSDANKTFTDEDGSILIRDKAAPKGWTYKAKGISFTTAELNSLSNKDVNGSDIGDVSIKFYDENGVELTTQTDLDNDCVKTVVTFEPTYDYVLIGGKMATSSTLSTDLICHVIAVPDLTPANGGTKVMVQNINLKFVSTKTLIETDGRVGKRLNYDATYHTNKLELTFLHPKDGSTVVKAPVQILFDLYKA